MNFFAFAVENARREFGGPCRQAGESAILEKGPGMMLPNATLFAQADSAPRRTSYAIKNVVGLWLAPNRKWLGAEHARRFEFMTMAIVFAVLEQGLEDDEFTVEAV